MTVNIKATRCKSCPHSVDRRTRTSDFFERFLNREIKISEQMVKEDGQPCDRMLHYHLCHDKARSIYFDESERDVYRRTCYANMYINH